jgi:hypothetical protein
VKYSWGQADRDASERGLTGWLFDGKWHVTYSERLPRRASRPPGIIDVVINVSDSGLSNITAICNLANELGSMENAVMSKLITGEVRVHTYED